MKLLIIKAAVARVREILDKTNELDQEAELKAFLVEAFETWLRSLLKV